MKKFRFGIAGGARRPEGVDPIEFALQTMRANYEKGIDAMGCPVRGDVDPVGLKEIAAAKKEYDMAMCVGCHGTMLFDKNTRKEARDVVEKSMQLAKALDEKFVRAGYGLCDFATTRYNQEIPLDEHITMIVEGMKALVPLCEEYDMDLLMENHCDFSGVEFAEIMERVGSDRVGIYLDTGNDITTWTDIFAGNTAMLPYVKHGGHVKDICGRLDPEYAGENREGRFPVQLVGCFLGEGLVDLKGIFKYLVEHSKPEDSFQFLVESLWVPTEFDMKAYQEEGLKYLRKITSELC